MSGVVSVAAPVRVRERLAKAEDGPRAVLHASATAIYVDLDGWCLGLVSADATRVPCALWSTLPDLTELGPAVRVEAGTLHVGAATVRIARLADVSVPTLGRHGDRGFGPARAMTSAAGLSLPDDGRLTPASTMTRSDVATWTDAIPARQAEAAPPPPLATAAVALPRMRARARPRR